MDVIATSYDQQPARANGARIDKNHALRAAATGGIVAALLSLLPLGLIVGAPAGGFMAVLLYRRRTHSGDPSPQAGFRLGVIAGAMGFVLFIALLAVQIKVSHSENQLRSSMIEAVHRQQARNPDPQSRQMLDYFLTPRGLAIMMIIGTLFGAVAFVLLAGLGGTVSAMLLRRQPPS